MERGPDPRIVIGLWPQSEDVGQQDEKLRVNAPHPPSTLARMYINKDKELSSASALVIVPW